MKALSDKSTQLTTCLQDKWMFISVNVIYRFYENVIHRKVFPMSALIRLVILSIIWTVTISGHANATLSKSVNADKKQNSRQHTTGPLHVASPDWRKQIVYFLMIDRFNDGDPSNNDQGADEYDPTVLKKFHGGDIAGVKAQLNYIEDLGATAVWMTPHVYNMWYSSASDYYGYHGYWALDFTKVDPHFGTLADYQSLSRALHARDMYLIQDIVVNHTAPLFGYDGKYDSDNTAANFRLFEKGFQSAPTQAPFDMINRLDPSHVEADIYNWTPPISDYADTTQQYTYQLANLADINTLNSHVIATFKQTYKDWMTLAGVDAFRIDTVKYAEPEFWSAFLHDKDGIYAHAKTLGKDHFLTFGEVFDGSRPFQNDGEQKVTYFLGDDQRPLLNSVIGFPLYFDISAVFAEGKPTAQLAYRLERFMTDYPDPYTTPNFVDNHDTKRFLASADIPAFKQALTLMFTIPGIPMIYQGSEHAYQTARAPLFENHELAQHPQRDAFVARIAGDTSKQFSRESEIFQFIKTLSALRLSHDALTIGNMEQLAANEHAPGLLAYRRALAATQTAQNIIVLFNTAEHPILAQDLVVSDTPTTFSTLLATYDHTEQSSAVMTLLKEGDKLNTDQNGKLTLTLPSKSMFVLKAQTHTQHPSRPTFTQQEIVTKSALAGEVFTEATSISGRLLCLDVCSNKPLWLIKNGRLDQATPVDLDAQQQFTLPIQVKDLGNNTQTWQFYQADSAIKNNHFVFTTQVETPSIQLGVADPKDDDVGISKDYRAPLQKNSHGQMDIHHVDVAAAGSILELTLTMQTLTDAWLPANGFDNVAFTIFMGDAKQKTGSRFLPMINGTFPQGKTWTIGHQLYGWGNSMFTPNTENVKRKGKRFSYAPTVTTDKTNNSITIRYDGNLFGIEDWQDKTIYITTWDMSGEGDYRPIGIQEEKWRFKGPSPEAPKILDDVFIQL